MTQILDSYTMDYTARVQHSQREDGQWFKRVQVRDQRYGYVWTKWTATSHGPAVSSVAIGRARLPKGGARLVVKSRENVDGGYDVVVIATGEVLSTWDSAFLAKKSVSTINRNIGR